MLQSYIYDKRKFTFANSFPGTSSNTFTLIVGKNGTGKSTLLRSIVVDTLRTKVSPTALKLLSDLPPSIQDFPIGKLIYNGLPEKVICASTSPFDKFPIPKRNTEIPQYSYLGLRGLPSQNLGSAYISRIIYTLISASMQTEAHANAIASVLEYLDYEPRIVTNSGITSATLIENIINATENGLRTAVDSTLSKTSFAPVETTSLMKQVNEADEKTLRRIKRAAIRLIEGSKKGTIVAVLGRHGVELPTHPNLKPEDLSLLGRYGLIRLKDVFLRKSGVDTSVRMNEMSSGEQSVVMGLLGIASQLQDNSLICVDEPEVCLHPEWQERYIQLLSTIFSHYRGCHFIIATHSPQMIAQLPDSRCYVMDMEEGLAYSSSVFAKKSVDFQLAALFKAPGFKNEYLSRIALNTFIKVAKSKKFDSESKSNYDTLIKTLTFLRNDDPIREIVESLLEMHKIYGRH
jgi:ABC-type multidrug transport system ATPase subunit